MTSFRACRVRWLDCAAWLRTRAAIETWRREDNEERRNDNGPEFTSRAFVGWTQRKQIQHLLIAPGKPMQSGFIEGIDGKLRDEYLDEISRQTPRQRAEPAFRKFPPAAMPFKAP